MTETTEKIRIPAKAFIAAASRAFLVSVEQITGTCRIKRFSHARFAVCFMLREHRPDFGLAEIGRRIGGKDHTTVLHGTKKARILLETDPAFRECYLAAERDALSYDSSRVQTATFTLPAPETPKKVGRPPVVKFGPPAPLRIVSGRSTKRRNLNYHGGDTTREWYAENDRRFSAVMRRVHPERCPSWMREAAE